MSAGLDVEAARKVLLDSLPPNNPKWRIWVDGVLERLEPCVTEDPRIEQIRALCDEHPGWIDLNPVRRILDGPTR